MLGQLLHVWNLYVQYLVGLVQPWQLIGVLTLTVNFLVDSSATIIHTDAASHLELSSLVDMNIDACFWYNQGDLYAIFLFLCLYL